MSHPSDPTSAADTFSLAGRVAIVTGASRGIGEAIARTLVSAGARVVLVSRKIDAAFEATFPKGSVVAVQAHTGKEEDCARLVAVALERFGRLDVLVNNAATNPYFGPMLDVPMSAWDKTFEVNVKGYFWLTQAATKHWIAAKSPGSAIFVTSIAGLMGTPGQGVYAMTKAALISMTKTLAIELAPHQIRVNAIAPGFVDTKFASAVLENETLLKEVTDRTPLRRYGLPSEIAGAALYLASSASSYTTGHTMVVDGGMSIA
jgi:NAD(P)-dependent dehydrogenase (short-subunit alcohol dehydrogenase family)